MKMIRLYSGQSSILAPETDLEYLESAGWCREKPKAKSAKAGKTEPSLETD